MSISYPGRARINPLSPEALGICGKCGFQYNLVDLRYQQRWAGAQLITTQLRVCNRCWDDPNEQFRSIRIPPDPVSVDDPRPEDFSALEKNFLNITRYIGWPYMFGLNQSKMTAELDHRPGIRDADFDVVSQMNVDFQYDAVLNPAFSDVSDVSATLQRDAVLDPAFSDTSDMSAVLEQVTPSGVSVSLEHSYNFLSTGSDTETSAPLGTAASDRLIFVVLSGLNATSLDAVDSMTIGGVSATLDVERVRPQDADPGTSYFSAIFWAAVPTGTTGNIVITFTGDDVAAGVSVYKITGADTTTPVGSNNNATVASGSVSASITPAALSATIATAMVGVDTSDEDITWSNITEDVDDAVNLGAFLLIGSASREDTSSPGSISISANATNDTITEKTLAIVNIVVP